MDKIGTIIASLITGLTVYYPSPYIAGRTLNHPCAYRGYVVCLLSRWCDRVAIIPNRQCHCTSSTSDASTLVMNSTRVGSKTIPLLLVPYLEEGHATVCQIWCTTILTLVDRAHPSPCRRRRRVGISLQTSETSSADRIRAGKGQKQSALESSSTVQST
jgi:hypothetical protein